ncbi:hypothetical protein DAPPUDRAFT_255633 [Daphnia pulex]|uniref:Methyltransferase FkbM domain-containing protein n=1 Tax=Daphnia pulex TaxID=6669 RepID=E9H9S0_DAPPU|nr:hypothetical protein DAPPUDRAFT_255633 [Daphnia pulex]|eukprot:EFX71561.1 hypothetical protein DAPPUDRAFT_255633 [Daphnia pulex]
MNEKYGKEWVTSVPPPGPECTIDYANANRLQQDHPCVIELIRSQYLHRPSLIPNVPLNLSHPEVADPSAAQSKVALTHLHNQTGGFFVECGAFDGEHGSNTLYMERHLQWKGILIEPDRKSFDKLLAKRRHSWALPVCLATEPHPTQVSFESNYEAGKIFGHEDDQNQANNSAERIIKEGIRLIVVQCFPLYSILLAVGRTRVDYFSLDVEGAESRILSHVPWHLVDVKTLTVEITSRKEQVVNQVTSHMRSNGFNSAGLIMGQGYYDLVFVNKRMS